jgi:hypothetical protein
VTHFLPAATGSGCVMMISKVDIIQRPESNDLPPQCDSVGNAVNYILDEIANENDIYLPFHTFNHAEKFGVTISEVVFERYSVRLPCFRGFVLLSKRT